MKDRTERIETAIRTPKLKGHTTVLYFDKWKRIVDRFDKDNAITDGIENLYKTALWANLGMNRSNGVFDFFGGCFVCDQELDTTGGIPTSLPAGIGITAHAGQRNRPSGDTNTKRGNPNTVESIDIAGGHRFVWDWTTDQGVGPVKAVCLTHRTNGFNGLLTKESLKGELLSIYGGDLNAKDYPTNADISLYNNFPTGAFYICLDPANDQYYTVHHTGSGEFEIERKALSMLHARMVKDHTTLSTHTATSTITTMQEGPETTCQLLNGYIYYSYVPDNNNKIYITKINTADFSDVTDITLTVPDATFVAVNNNGYSYTSRFIHNGYIYLRGGSTSVLKIYKVNLSDQTDVEELTNDIGQTPDFVNSYNTMVEINGYIYLFSNGLRPSFVIDTENDSVHDAPRFFTLQDYAQNFGIVNLYNNIINIQNSLASGNRWCALAPNFISTMNNLGPDHAPKTNDISMKVIYEITEV